MRVQDLAEEFGTFQLRMEQRLDENQAQIATFNNQLQQIHSVLLGLESRCRDPGPQKEPSSSSSSSHMQGDPPLSSIPEDPPHTNGRGGVRVDHNDPRSFLKFVRMEFPAFLGVDPNGWIFKTEMLYELQHVPEEYKVRLAGSKWKEQLYLDFKTALYQRFGVESYMDLKGVLSKLTQSGALKDYIREFEALINQVTEFSDEVLASFFISGLHVDLRRAIQFHNPTSLHQAMKLAVAYEAHHSELRTSFSANSKPLYGRQSEGNPPFSSSPQVPQVKPINSVPALPAPNLPPVKKLSHEYLQKRRESGLCYHCNEKWNVRHRCQWRMLLLIGEEDELGDQPDEQIVWQPEAKTIEMSDAALHSMVGDTNPRALHFDIPFHGEMVQVLIDSGSSHNFINRELAEKFDLPMSRTTKMRVYLGNGEFLLCEKKCLDVKLLIQGHQFVVDLWVIELHDLGIILGIMWLAKLGRVIHDYDLLTMEFEWCSKRVLLKGDSDQHSNSKLMLHLGVQQSNAEDEMMKDKVSPELWKVLVAFQVVFQIPNALPPFRGCNHSIHLEEGAKPVSLRPYRYAYHQKAEIEQQVADLLTSGYIQESRSPFSSPVLLVKKQDGTWRMCIDYR
ncbi:uncharacterized protein LOC133298640 [Gastrolobium bilobum]|uniref:uncharacterized protein LOC133298640 n=1 Tax=Gastrolobium bilobum TaxID=150636 RepID=UPI002AB279C8|nr:uncharacterized protein LOC133298640 [Gastrolobium bilobum]